jgi:hypothetical protein
LLAPFTLIIQLQPCCPLADLGHDAGRQGLVALRVQLGHVRVFVAEDALTGFQPIALSDLGGTPVAEL